MLADENMTIRVLALRRILKARQRKNNSSTVRSFKVPPLNLSASNYTEMIDWQIEGITEPPLTSNISSKDLIDMIRSEQPFIEIDNYPCHNQAVERHVKLVTETAGCVCGEDNRDGFIRARLESRRKMQKFESKKRLQNLKFA